MKQHFLFLKVAVVVIVSLFSLAGCISSSAVSGPLAKPPVLSQILICYDTDLIMGWSCGGDLSWIGTSKPPPIKIMAIGLEPNGRKLSINPTWSTNPIGVIQIVPNIGSVITATVISSGNCTLTATVDGVSKTTKIHITQHNDTWTFSASE